MRWCLCAVVVWTATGCPQAAPAAAPATAPQAGETGPSPAGLADGAQLPREDHVSDRDLLLAGRTVTNIVERWAAKTRTVHRESRLLGGGDDVSKLKVTLTPQGFVESARYERRGPRGDRTLVLSRQSLQSGGRERTLSGQPIVLLETLCWVAPAGKTLVELVDVATGESLSAQVERGPQGVRASDRFGGVISQCEGSGIRVGPGGFVEVKQGTVLPPRVHAPVTPAVTVEPERGGALVLGGRGVPAGALALHGPGQRVKGSALVDPTADFASLGRPILLDDRAEDRGAPTAADREPGLFIESDDEKVRAFSRQHAEGILPVKDALALTEAVAQLLDTSRGGGPPSAVLALGRRAGDCDDATALLTASLRAAGHAARPVVGYRAAQGRWVPHAWTEVWDGERWLPADAMVPGLGPFPTHLKLFEGLGSPLTLGRTLGALEIAVLPPVGSRP